MLHAFFKRAKHHLLWRIVNRFIPALCEPLMRKKTRTLHIATQEETLNYIIENRCSVARFGDGEFELMNEKKLSINFQSNHPELKKKLWDAILRPSSSNYITCIPRTLISRRNLKKFPLIFWRWYLCRFALDIWPYMNQNLQYFDSMCTRPYADNIDTSNSSIIFEKWKQVWLARNVLLVEGEKSRLGVANDLFDTANRVRRILIPPIGAFSYYDEILNSIKLHYEKDDIVLLAAGPTATAMAYDLALLNIQAIDIGHIDVEYCWFQMKAERKMPIAGKWVNEAGGYTPCDDIFLEEYHASIVDTVLH